MYVPKPTGAAACATVIQSLNELACNWGNAKRKRTFVFVKIKLIALQKLSEGKFPKKITVKLAMEETNVKGQGGARENLKECRHQVAYQGFQVPLQRH